MAMRHDDFEDFVGEYILTGFVVGLICVALGLVFGALVFSDHRTELEKENMLYLAIQGEKIESSSVKEAAGLIKSMATKPGENLLENHLQSIERLKELGGADNFYLKLIFKKKGKIISLAQGKIKASELLVEVTKWGVFWNGWIILSIIGLILACTINLCWETINDGESLFFWPWNKWWVYPSILLLSPALIPAMAIEVVIRIIAFIVVSVIEFFGWLIRYLFRSRPESEKQRAKVREQSLEDKKKAALETIKAIKDRMDATKERWSRIYLRGIEIKTRELRERVSSSRSSLSELGQRISSTQKELAESQRQLNEWEETLEQQKDKKKEDCFRDFDQLVNLPHVEAVEITDEQLRVYTDIIYIDYGFRRRYEIGIFIIKIGLEYNDVGLENLSSTHPSGLYHPYGDGGGFCWGALSSPISHAINRKEYFVAVQYILQAIQSAEGDNRSKVTQWKEV